MRSLVASIFLALALADGLAGTVMGAEPLQQAVAQTRRELERLKVQERLYWQVEHPRQLHELSAAIQFTQAEIDVLQERVRYYRDWHRSHYQAPPLESKQNAELALLDAELRLRLLRQERLAVRRSFAASFRLLELQIAATRARLVELERQRLGDMP